MMMQNGPQQQMLQQQHQQPAQLQFQQQQQQLQQQQQPPVGAGFQHSPIPGNPTPPLTPAANLPPFASPNSDIKPTLGQPSKFSYVSISLLSRASCEMSLRLGKNFNLIQKAETIKT